MSETYRDDDWSGSDAAMVGDGRPLLREVFGSDELTAVADQAMRPTGGVGDSTLQYLNEIGRHPLLNAEQERELAKIIEAGRSAQAALEDDSGELSTHFLEDIQRAIEEASRARETFITSNLRLVVSIARRYPVPPGMELLDLIQEGNFGLERAVEKFDWHKGFKFSTYATGWIRHFITNALHVDSRLIRLPREPSMELQAGLLAVGSDGDQLQDPEIARLHALSTTVSLDYTYDEMSQGTTLGERLPSNIPGPEQALFDRLEREQATAFIDDLLQTLDDGPRRIAVIGRLGLNGSPPLSNEEVGRILGVTTEAAQKLYLRGLDTICAAQGVKRPKRRRSKPPDKE